MLVVTREHDAEDAVQEASLRALRYFGTYTGGNGRAWFLRIVRNTWLAWREHKQVALTEPFDEEHLGERPELDPESLVMRTEDVCMVKAAINAVPERQREMLMPRELNGLSYRELADTLGMPIGTLMSSLSRGRQALRKALQTAQDSQSMDRVRIGC